MYDGTSSTSQGVGYECHCVHSEIIAQCDLLVDRAVHAIPLRRRRGLFPDDVRKNLRKLSQYACTRKCVVRECFGMQCTVVRQ